MRIITITALIILGLYSCTERKSTTGEEPDKVEAFQLILSNESLSEEMADSLLHRYPGIIQSRIESLEIKDSIKEVEEIIPAGTEGSNPGEPVEEVEKVESKKNQAPVNTSKKQPEKETPEKVEEKKTDTKEEVVKKENVIEKTPEPEKPKEEPVKVVNFKISSGEIKVEGTSTLHDWEMVSTSFSGQSGILLNQSGSIEGLESFNFSLPVKNLKSDEKKMNDIAWDALKADKHNAISFRLKGVKVTPAGNNNYKLDASGSLTIAGVTKDITLDVTGTSSDNNSIVFSGSKKINMTDYEVKPPTFMLGAMKTGEEVTISFKVIMAR